MLKKTALIGATKLVKEMIDAYSEVISFMNFLLVCLNLCKCMPHHPDYLTDKLHP